LCKNSSLVSPVLRYMQGKADSFGGNFSTQKINNFFLYAHRISLLFVHPALSLIRKSRGNKHTITTSKEEINNSHIENPINDEVALDTILDL
jgi:hypothetical protein